MQRRIHICAPWIRPCYVIKFDYIIDEICYPMFCKLCKNEMKRIYLIFFILTKTMQECAELLTEEFWLTLFLIGSLHEQQISTGGQSFIDIA